MSSSSGGALPQPLRDPGHDHRVEQLLAGGHAAHRVDEVATTGSA